jgi:hypothetical protein
MEGRSYCCRLLQGREMATARKGAVSRSSASRRYLLKIQAALKARQFPADVVMRLKL